MESRVRVPEAAKFLAVSENTIRKWCFLRLISFEKIGDAVVFRISDLEAFAQSRYRPALVTPNTAKKAVPAA